MVVKAIRTGVDVSMDTTVWRAGTFAICTSASDDAVDAHPPTVMNVTPTNENKEGKTDDNLQNSVDGQQTVGAWKTMHLDNVRVGFRVDVLKN